MSFEIKESVCPRWKKNITKIEKSCFPFCSKRCKDVDLGKWFGEEYKVACQQSLADEVFEEYNKEQK